MKTTLSKSLLAFIILLILSNSAAGQERIVIKPCFDSTLQRQADSLKAMYTKAGFIVLKEAMINMRSEFELPIIVPLTEGTWYQFAFIGDPDSRLYEVRMYDWQERQVIYKKHYAGGQSNVIDFYYIPKGTEYHVIKPVQVSGKKKKKELCGYVILFKRVK